MHRARIMSPRLSMLALAFPILAVACGSSSSTGASSGASTGSSGDPGSSSSSGGSSSSSSGGTGSSSTSSGSGSSSFECTLGARGADSLKTTYSCPDQASFDECSGGDSTSCTPKDKKAGTVALGGACKKAFAAGAPGDEYELADDCAPIAEYGGQGAAKGSYCAFGYCTHACAQTSECTDVAATAKCAQGSCSK